MKENQKQLFTIIYKLIMNQSNGPRIPLLIHVVGIENHCIIRFLKQS